MWGSFSYRLPEALVGKVWPGHRVLVPFQNRPQITAFVLQVLDEAPPGAPAKLREVRAVMEPEPLLPSDLLELAAFASDYYVAPLGEVLRVALPPGLVGAEQTRLFITQAGRSELDGVFLEPSEAKLLNLAAKSRGLLKTQAKIEVAERLVARGWITERSQLTAKAKDEGESAFAICVDKKEAWPVLKNAPRRQELYALLEEGPRSLSALKRAMGPGRLQSALKRLKEEGIIEACHLEGASPSPACASGEGPALTSEQAQALEPIYAAIADRRSEAFLLNGVTGSGKTEVYLQAIGRAIQEGGSAIVLVPEIALTPQLEARFVARFGGQVVVLHSGISDAERRRRWFRLARGEAHIALGPRSALWAPVVDLRMVVVDEEHDASFKQNDDLRYNGRDLALVRAKQRQAVAVLGSATPSLESLNHVVQGRLWELRLTRRVEDRPLPKITLVDLSEKRAGKRRRPRLISEPLADRLRQVIADKQQAILFLNRRGFNTVMICETCASAQRCPSCAVSLTYHQQPRPRLACHYCGYERSTKAPCSVCQSPALMPFGAGTEQVEEAVHEELPDARVLRLDRDVTQKVGALEAVLAAFRAGEADILVGTQMVAKGHDFPRVTLVGVILADASLAFPDFRAAERTYQLLTQVAGRAGRAEHPGEVMIQTFQPEHYAIEAVVNHDAEGFVAIEMPSREALGYPPVGRMAMIRIESPSQKQAESDADLLRSLAQSWMPEGFRGLGPSPAPIERIRDRWRLQYLLLGPRPSPLVRLLHRLRAEMAMRKVKSQLIFDMDPLDLL